MKYLDYLLIFLVVLAFFTWLHSDPTLADPDSFYHAKMSLLMRDNGLVIKDFVWLPFTVLRTSYIDHHWLYHIFLIPFVTFFPPLIGIKIATVFLAVLMAMIFYWLLKKLAVKYPWFYVLILITSSPFIFRLGLAKTSAFSIIFLLVGYYLLAKKRHWLLMALSFFYVWLYGGFILLPVISFFYALGEMSVLKFKMKLKQFLLTFKPLGFSLLGMALGLIINPYFPKNLYFYWVQVIEVAVVNYQKTIGVGAEWYPYMPFDLLGKLPLLFILLFLAILVFVLKSRRRTVNEWTLLFLTLAFLLLTVKSRRNVEYFVPWAMLFSAVAISQETKNWVLDRIKKVFKRTFFRYKLFLVVAAYILITFGYLVYQGAWQTKRDYALGIPLTRLSLVGQWLKDNVPPKEVVFHSDWDDFPMLFYYDSQNYYINGLDPTFMYKYSPAMYDNWVAITKGEQKSDLDELIKKGFHASYVVVDKDHTGLKNNLNITPGAKRVFESDDAWVYRLK